LQPGMRQWAKRQWAKWQRCRRTAADEGEDEDVVDLLLVLLPLPCASPGRLYVKLQLGILPLQWALWLSTPQRSCECPRLCFSGSPSRYQVREKEPTHQRKFKAGAAQLVQNLKAKTQSVLQDGDWTAAWLLTGIPDPLATAEVAGTRREMAVVSGYGSSLTKPKKLVKEVEGERVEGTKKEKEDA
jgi:hypothetical protein